MDKTQRGFTLIELMIVVVILAFIASYAMSSYYNQVQQTRRAAVQTEMLELAQNLERCMTRTNSYAGCNIADQESEDGRYDIAVASDATSFTLTATPKPGESQSDDACGTMSLNHLSVKTGAQPDCWDA